jgi:hypothetical protein
MSLFNSIEANFQAVVDNINGTGPIISDRNVIPLMHAAELLEVSSLTSLCMEHLATFPAENPVLSCLAYVESLNARDNGRHFKNPEDAMMPVMVQVIKSKRLDWNEIPAPTPSDFPIPKLDPHILASMYMAFRLSDHSDQFFSFLTWALFNLDAKNLQERADKFIEWWSIMNRDATLTNCSCSMISEV